MAYLLKMISMAMLNNQIKWYYKYTYEILWYYKYTYEIL